MFPLVLILWRSSSTIGVPLNDHQTSGFGLHPTSHTNLKLYEFFLPIYLVLTNWKIINHQNICDWISCIECNVTSEAIILAFISNIFVSYCLLILFGMIFIYFEVMRRYARFLLLWTMTLLHLEAISSTIYECVFHTKFWCQKLQSCVLGLNFFGAKISYEKFVHKTLMKYTAGGNPIKETLNLSQIPWQYFISIRFITITVAYF